MRKGTPGEIATQESLNTAFGVERVARYAFDRAAARPRQKLTLVHKTNVLTYAGDLWQRTVDRLAKEFADVSVDYAHVDAASMFFVTQPERFDVVVTDNLFGDILTDLGAAIAGGIGLAASGNINPGRRRAQHVRAGARQRARHRGPAEGRPDRGHLVRGHALRPPGADRRGGQDRAGRRGRPGRAPGRPGPAAAPRKSATTSPSE